MDILNIILHLDQHIAWAVHNYHHEFYLLFFLVIFCETGLLVTPFLPGDSLLFTAGALAGSGQLELPLLVITIFSAAFLGDNSNFFIGRYLGAHLFKNPKSKIFRKDFLQNTHIFYEKHGRKTLIIARLVPIIRTFAPFVAGLGTMAYPRFIIASLLGSLLWVSLFIGGGFLFGNLPFVRDHLSIIFIVVMFISVLPFA